MDETTKFTSHMCHENVASYVKKPTFPCNDWRVLGSLSITLWMQFFMRNVFHNDNKVMENDWNYYCRNDHFPLESENFVIVLETNLFIQILDLYDSLFFVTPLDWSSTSCGCVISELQFNTKVGMDRYIWSIQKPWKIYYLQ